MQKQWVAQLRYLPQSVKIEESTDSKLLKYSLVILNVVIGVFILWAAFTRVNEVTNAKGQVIPRGFVQMVQHLDGGIVTDIITEEGAMVKEGDVLIKVDDGGTEQELAELMVKRDSLKIKAEQLSAFVESRKPDFSAYNEKMRKDQQAVFNAMIDAKKKERSVIEQQLEQKKEEVSKLKTKIATLKKNLELENETIKLQEELFEKGLTSRIKLISHQKERNKIQSEIDELNNEVKQGNSAINESKNLLGSIDAKHRDETFEELSIVESKIAQSEEQRQKMFKKEERLTIRSPVDGIVKGLKVNTIGAVINPGQTIMEVVPINGALMVEARISPSDIGHVHVGQAVQLKISSYDFSRYGALEGTLESVSATTFTNQYGEIYYKGRISVPSSTIGEGADEKVILPGMTVEADIITGEKSILAYLLKPIHRSVQTALSER